LPGVTRAPEQLLSAGERPLLVSARYVRDDGRLRHAVITARDTAARERLERSAADLVSTVAHELRSPLTSVKGFTATLLAKWDRFTDEQKQIMLQTVNADADRVTRLISELLDVSRIDSGRLELHRQVVDVAGAVRRACDGHVAQGEPPERFVLEELGTPPEMWLDPDKLDQIVGNLVENALRHGDGTVTVVVQATDDGVDVTVTDEGEGVDEEIQPMIFGKFWRGRRRRGGTGLGLYITKGLVEAHGGMISVAHAPGGGAQFRFTLPAGTPSFM
jgi:signal transduction histidine kinase